MNAELEKIGYASNNPYRATRDGKEYEELFPVPDWHEKRIPGAKTVDQTVEVMSGIIQRFAWQTEFLSKQLEGGTLYQTCKNIWSFLYDHIKYKQDDEGEEQLRTPALSWHIRTSRGIDCDDFSIFAGTILYNLGIPFYLRIAKYPDPFISDPPFSHVYVVVPISDKRYIVIDAVLDSYDTEKTPIKQYKDFKVMENSDLKGIDVSVLSGIDENTEAQIESFIGAWFPGRGELEGAWFPERGEMDAATPSGEAELDAIYKHLIETRNLIATNPSLIKNNEDPQSFLKVLDYAIRYWNTDKRDEALAILAEKEKEINGLSGLGEMTEDYEEFSLYYGISGLDGINVLGKAQKVRQFFNKIKTAATQVKNAAVNTVKTAAQNVGQTVKSVAKDAFKAIVKVSPITVSSRAGMLLALKLNIGKMAERLKWGYLTQAEAQRHGFDIDEWRKLKDRLAKAEHLYVNTMQGSAQHFKDAILTGRAGGLSGLINIEEDNLGVEPVTASATLIATSLPFIKKIIDVLKDVDMKKLTTKVKTDLLRKTQKAAEARIQIPSDIKTALPDNQVKPDTQIEVKPEIPADQNLLPDPTIKTAAPAPKPEEQTFITKAGAWIKENPGKSVLIAGVAGLTIFAVATRGRMGLGFINGKGRHKKGKKKKNPPKVVAKPKRKAKGKGKGGAGKTVHL